MRTRLPTAILVALAVPVIACLGTGVIAETPTVTDASPSVTLTSEPDITETLVTPSPTAVQPSETTTHTPIPSTATPDYTDFRVDIETSTSPDGMWTAELIMAYQTQGYGPLVYYQSLTVRSTDGSITWVLIDNWAPFVVGATYTDIIGWSSQVFYFSEYAIVGGCDPFAVDLNVWRLSLVDGSVTEMPIEAGSRVALSPDGAHAAYIGTYRIIANTAGALDTPQIVIHDLATGELRSAPLDVGDDFWDAGGLVWSPDGQSLMLTIDHNICKARSIIRVDVSSFTQRILIDHSDRSFRTQSWPEADRVVLRERDVGLWWMDAETGEIIGPKPDG